MLCQMLYLLLTKDDGKPESVMAQMGYGMNAAVLSDLMLAGRIELTDEKRPRVLVLDEGPCTDPLLAAALAKLAKKHGKRLESVVTISNLCDIRLVTDSLASAGIVEYGERGFFGLGKERAVVLKPELEAQIRASLRAAIHGEKEPELEDVTLLSILQGLDLAPKVLAMELAPLNRKQAKERIKYLAQNSPTGDAVGKAVAAMNTVLMTTVIMPGIAGGSV
ncbi:hypothetical protein AUR04nite_04730 [Glutamicibacter uratoxydans]|uniref:GPP34 family phosphoprotein n=2 Tax=Glutamicibacter uratoxydans TaxID=43667 RepID=A0A4Y4DR08_GLUUR|nr:hypothetical protein AUR04nite_04730 [Glutamicibacter uratoxydans]